MKHLDSDKMLEPCDLPQLIQVRRAPGHWRRYEVTIVDERGDFKTVVAGCVNQDDAYDAVVPYVNTNYLKKVRIKTL